ncbi:MAG: molecular chaperone DjlA [Bacteroidetes bacterium]|nr:MAG: molecular chaperone DjlA [Bacteroidota bacterium]REK05750.1 MAG: molecular chaperone DjlA [Bacteroidota bacterium]REK31943.1 MAG: molecular chaperone DjlA [Bacteroidota bacterium]REK50009.1 MAG: molecular chaperone DjlA [Bacteroidota bacterium]
MKNWNKWILGGLGWALGGPIGGIIGFALGSITEEGFKEYKQSERLLPNDFSAALLVLCAAVMKADNKVLVSELDFVRRFFIRTFGEQVTQHRMLLFREILKQDIAIGQVCEQVRQNVDPASRLELIHLLFGLAASDGSVGPQELNVLSQISTLIGVNHRDFESIKAMFIKDTGSAYKILEIEKSASNDELKKAYRKMAMKFHPDKVHHLGPEFQQDAQEKFKKINDAYEQIKKERGIV